MTCNQVKLENKTFNLLKDVDLLSLNSIKKISWNTEPIIDFINNNETLKYIYLTQSSNNEFFNKFNYIKEKCHRKNIIFRKIYTPSGQKLSGKPRHVFLAIQWLIDQKDNGFSVEWLHEKNIHSYDFDAFSLNF